MSTFLEGAGDPIDARQSGEARAIPRHRILFVEDHRDPQQVNTRVLVDSGYAVDLAEDGAAAWEALNANRYDLLITDNRTPKLIGMELLEKLRSAWIELPTIIATAMVPPQELASNPWPEPVATLVKPCAPDQLLEVVEGVLHPGLAKSRRAGITSNCSDVESFSVERYTASRKPEWDKFVTAAKNATFLFSRDYMDYHGDRFSDHSLMIFHHQTLVAVLPANLNPNGSLVTHEGLTYGGLVLSRTATLGEVLACFYVLLRYLSERQISKLVYKRIPALYTTLPDDDAAYALFILEARLYRRDCSNAILQTDQLPFRTNHKRLIKKAKNLGVRIVQQGFQPFWDQVLTPQLSARYGVQPVHTLEEITLLALRFPGQIKQFSAYSGDEIVAGTTIYETPTVAHSQYAAVTERGRQLGAQACLFYSLIEKYKNKRFFDFGIVNENEGRTLNHGLLDWKEGFGARSYAHDFYEIATANYPKLQPVLSPRLQRTVAPTELGPESVTAAGDRPGRAYFAHPKALVDEGVSIGQRTRVWAFAHVAGGAVIGEDCNLCDHTFIEGGVRMGDRVTIKCGVYLWDGLTIEDDVFIGPSAVFSNDLRPRSKKYLSRPFANLLKQGCTLGAGSTILPGLTIGRWAMVGAAAVVTHDVPDHALMVGSPARWRAWVCRCGEKLLPTSGRFLGCKCGQSYEQISPNQVKEAKGCLQAPKTDLVGTESGKQVSERNSHTATHGRPAEMGA